jgi:hypothetical protein
MEMPVKLMCLAQYQEGFTRVVVAVLILYASRASAIMPLGHTNHVTALIPNAASAAPARAFPDSLEFAICRYIAFSAHGKLADISFPSWTAAIVSLALPALVALLLVIIQHPNKLSWAVKSKRFGQFLFLVAWCSSGVFLGGMLFGGFDFGILTAVLARALSWFASALWWSHKRRYRQLVRTVTVIYCKYSGGL